MSGVNKVILVGRLGKDPEMRTTQAGKTIGTFSMATSQRWKDKSGDWKERTEWHNIVVFNQGLAGIVSAHLSKGSQCYVEGELRTRKWQDKNGADRWSTEVVLDGFSSKLELLDGYKKADGSKPSGNDGGSSNDDDFDDDDIPF